MVTCSDVVLFKIYFDTDPDFAWTLKLEILTKCSIFKKIQIKRKQNCPGKITLSKFSGNIPEAEVPFLEVRQTLWAQTLPDSFRRLYEVLKHRVVNGFQAIFHQ